MANFTARVELHHATYQDYEVLHAAMQSMGYARTISGDDGSIYYLPTGTYDVAATTASLDQAYNAAVAAAKKTGKNYELIVAERTAAKWVGLTKKQHAA